MKHLKSYISSYSTFKTAVVTGNILLLKKLIRDNSVSYSNINEEIIECINKNKFSVFKTLIKSDKFDITYKNQVFIRSAAEMGRTKMLKILLVHPDSDPTADDNWAVKISTANLRYDTVKLLLSDSRIDLTSSENTPRNSPFNLALSEYENNHSKKALKMLKLLIRDQRTLKHLTRKDLLNSTILNLLIDEYDAVNTLDDAKIFIDLQ